ncbi:TIGR01777 family oxidoreductase [Aquimarina pacifica]|uniref:TIGR01777 family oxidoreductase n=1 Tax=Aquimarina pacifica TaxID=1296415 RepID=UPI00046F40D5|nr:TIGR01777 family oxidoreductase [Aquimarina pacifica]
MKVLITGATGLIGKEIVSLCHQSGIDVNYLTTNKAKIRTEPNYKGFLWDLQNREIDTKCFEDVEVVINLVGATVAKRWTSSYKKEIIESRVASASLLLESLKNIHHSIRHVVSASAIGIYPDSFQNYYTEDMTLEEDGFLGQVVRKWENSIHQFNTLDIEVSLLRIGLVLSDRGGAFPKIERPIRLGFGAFFGNGNQWQSWIHVDDVARMFVFVIEKELVGTFNAVAPNPVSNKKMTCTIAQKLNKKIILPNVPKLAMKLMLGEMHILLFSSQRVSCDKISDLGFVYDYDSIDHAVASLL